MANKVRGQRGRMRCLWVLRTSASLVSRDYARGAGRSVYPVLGETEESKRQAPPI